MATTLSQYGLIPDDQKKQASVSVGADPNSANGQSQLSSPFAGLAAPSLSSNGPVATPEIAQYAFNPRYAAIDRELQSRLADAGLDRSNSIGSINQQYQTQLGDAGRAKDKAIGNLIDRFAGQGILWSGINTGAQADLGQDYQRYVGGLGNSRANSLADVERGYAGLIRDVNAQRAGMWGQQGAEEEAARLESARQAQAAQAAQQQAAMLAQMQQQMIQAQQQALSAQPAGVGGTASYSTPVGGGVDVGGGAGGASDPALLGMINSSDDWNFLNNLTQNPMVQGDQRLMDATINRIKQLTAAGTAQQKTTGNYQRTKAY